MKKHRGRCPEDAVRIDRKTKWGNPFVIGRDGSRERVVEKFRGWALAKRNRGEPPFTPQELESLRGRDLACWLPSPPVSRRSTDGTYRRKGKEA